MTKPSLSDFGTYDESTVPQLWKGVVGAWCPSLGPTGSRLHDFSRFNNWGTLTNMDPLTDWVVDGGQYALDFDAVNDYVVAGSLPDFPNDCTWSAWGYVYAGDTGSDSILLRTTTVLGGAARNGVTILLYPPEYTSKAAVEITIGTTRYVVPSDNTLARETWYLITGVRRSGTLEMFVDGKQQASTASYTGTITNESSTYFGKSPDYTPSALRTRGDAWCVWNRALTPNEIRELYLLGRGGMFQRRRVRRGYVVDAAVRSYLFLNRGQVIGGGTL